jgi:inner membrane protein
VTGRTHALVGLAALWLLVPLPGSEPMPTLVAMCASAALGALLPDLDAGSSTIAWIEVAGIRPFAPLARWLARTLVHRGVLHSPVCLLALATGCLVLAAYVGWQVPAALWLGYASHLAADALTVSGIPLWRKPSPRLHLVPKRLRFRTGSPIEEIVTVSAACAALYFLLRNLFHG